MALPGDHDHSPWSDAWAISWAVIRPKTYHLYIPFGAMSISLFLPVFVAQHPVLSIYLHSVMHSESVSSTSTPRTTDTVLPIGPGDEKLVFLSGRHAGLPDMYIQSNHPLHVQAGLSGHAIYYIQDGSPSGMKRVTKLEHWELEIPSGGEQSALDKGTLALFYCLVPWPELSTKSQAF